MIDRPLLTIPVADQPLIRNRSDRRKPRVTESGDMAKLKFGNYSKQDPMWPYLWYINRHVFNKNLTDMNITSAWQQGYTGKGVSVTFLDDGLEWDHPDIVQNYVSDH